MNDTVCATTSGDLCVTEFCFFKITSETGLGDNDGILGLSPADPEYSSSFVSFLYDQGQIDQEIVSFWLN